jgi:hypothetical protein
LQIVSVESGSGGIKINLTTDLTSYLNAGDSIYVYSEGANYTYDGVGIILSLTPGDITVDIPYIQNATGGYINYLKNYYVELQCVDKQFSSSNKLPFNLTSDGDAAGNIEIDVSIVNDLNKQRGKIADGLISESVQEFEIQYREVYDGSSNGFTLIDNKLIVLVYATDTPEKEKILNNFELPKIYMGYEAALVIAKEADVPGSTMIMYYTGLNENKKAIEKSQLSELNSDQNGFLMWKISFNLFLAKSFNTAIRFLEFDFITNAVADYDSNDYDSNDYVTN